MKSNIYFSVLKLVSAIVLFVLGFIISPFIWIASYLLISYDLFIKIGKNISKKIFFDETFLMVIASLGAIILKSYEEAIMIIWLYQLGELFSGETITRSKKSIVDLLDLRVEKTDVKRKDKIISVDTKEVKKNEIIIVKPGEKIPLDGVVIKGKSFLDTASLTGESRSKQVTVNDTVLSGAINLNSVLEIKVTNTYDNSTASKILKAMEEASEKKAQPEKFITKFARIYTPIVILGAFLLFLIPVLCFHEKMDVWGYRSLIFLVSSCPCALIVSIPLCYFCGLGVASQNKVLLKGSAELEKLNDIDIVAFDKTGTITQGNFKITKIIPYYKKREELLKFLAHAEYYSNHPIANVIKAEYNKIIDKEIISDYEEMAGYGIKVKVDGENVLVGNPTLFDKEKIDYPKVNFLGTVVLVALNREYIGTVVISDEVKESSYSIVSSLKENAIKKVVMISGDSKDITKKISDRLGFDEYYDRLLPEDKIKRVKELKEEGTVLFVGDGLNDAPVMVEADLSIAMGLKGSDASIEASDMVIMNDDLTKIITARNIAKKTKEMVLFNIVFSISIKMLVMVLGAFGMVSIWFSVFADVGVTFIVILNALRIFKQTY